MHEQLPKLLPYGECQELSFKWLYKLVMREMRTRKQ